MDFVNHSIRLKDTKDKRDFLGFFSFAFTELDSLRKLMCFLEKKNKKKNNLAGIYLLDFCRLPIDISL